jgi:hypothetical protein
MSFRLPSLIAFIFIFFLSISSSFAQTDFSVLDKLPRIIQTTGKLSDASMYIGASKDAGETLSKSFFENDNVDIVAKVNVANDDIGAEAEIYIVTRVTDGKKKKFFYIDEDGIWHDWNASLKSLEPAKTITSLSEEESINIFSGQMTYGEFAIYVGYKVILDNESRPINVNLTPYRITANLRSSYSNLKDQNIHNLEFPILGWERWESTVNTFSLTDFRNSGNKDLVTATIRYDTTQPYSNFIQDGKVINDENLSLIVFWENIDGEWVSYYEDLGCLMPRKAITADFNNDGYQDIFFACIGWDGPPPEDVELWAGEQSFYYLNNGDGTFEKRLLDGTRYLHGAATGDVNRDGYLDIVVVDVTRDWNTQGIYTLINDKNGGFVDSYEYIPVETKNNIAIELVDIDGDFDLDLLVGTGVENDTDQRTLIYTNENSIFEISNVVAPIEDRDVILDFIYNKNLCSTCIYILRTGSYNTVTIQKYDFVSGASEVIYDHVDKTGGKWLAWIMPVQDEFGEWSIKPFSPRFNYSPVLLPVTDFGK